MRFHQVPDALPLAPRPREGELRSGWLRRVAAANALTFPELLHALATILPDPHLETASLDYRVSPACSHALARWCRLPRAVVERLDVAQLFPATPAEWFVQDLDGARLDDRTPPLPFPRLRFCVACLRDQQRRGEVVHLRATWSLPWLTHCPDHQCWFLEHCFGCHRPDALDMNGIVYGRVGCRHCGASLNLPLWTERRHSPVLQLQHTLLACSRMQRPDPSWVGRCGAQRFLQLAHDLLHLVMIRDEHDHAVLADYLPERDWDFPRLRLRAHHRFPNLSACERFTLLSAITAVLRGASAPSARAIDPLRRLWQVLTPSRQRVLLAAGRGWPRRIRQRLLLAAAGHHSTISIHRSTI